jgi:hypothetical protein
MSRRISVGLLGACLVTFLFMGAVHSVHHLDSDIEATACWVASAAASLSIVTPALVILDGLVRRPIGRAVETVSTIPAFRPPGVSRGRAPPRTVSA